jgi:predicted lysophospholipase L1 biosynthesis ABC-type transport system permease subunit
VAGPNRFYRLLLKLYPARFREEFAAPLKRQFADEYRETHGAGPRALFWLRTLADWAATLPAEMTRELRQDVRYAARYLAPCRDAAQAADPQVPAYDVETLDQRLSENLARPRLYTSAVLFLGVLALLLAMVGTYGVASYSITQRTHEIGVRIAVGASPRGLRGMLLRQSMLPVACGALAGIAGAAALGRYLQHLIANADATGPLTCAVAAAALAATAALAVWTATGRVVRMDPTAALRAE